MKKSDFHFECPEELIAKHPCAERSASRLLYVPKDGAFCDKVFTDVEYMLQAGDLLVLNDTRVMRARLLGRKATGGKAEILIERLLTDDTALAHIKASKAPRIGGELEVGIARLTVTGRQHNLFVIRIDAGSIADLLARHGQVPLPVYIRRNPVPADEERYQTVYARNVGSVAAPTAGLHFDLPLLNRLKERGVTIETLTLHIGAGTFQPIKHDNLDEHTMHSEHLSVSEKLCQAVNQCRARGGRVVAVGSTVLRALETAAADGEPRPFDGETDLFIQPGYRFQVCDVLITNFHLPESTLFVLVCAFARRDRMFAAYQHAIERRYRFYSYGDSMYLERSDALQS